MIDFPYAGEQENWQNANKLFPVHITDLVQTGGTWSYTWKEQSFDPTTGTYSDAISPRSGDKTAGPFLVEINNVQVATPKYVWARLRGIVAGQVYYEFSAGVQSVTAGAITVKDDAGRSFTGISTVQVDAGNGLTVSSPTPGAAEVNVQAAGPTGPGVVTTGSQTFVGSKTFNTGINVTGGIATDGVTASGSISVGGSGILQVYGPSTVVGSTTPLIVGLNVYKNAVGVALSGAEYLWAQWVVPASFGQRKFQIWNDPSGGQPCFSIYYGGTAYDGKNGTLADGSTVTGGLITNIGASGGGASPVTVGTTPITGGLDGDVLTVSGGKLGQVPSIDGGTF